jgi:endonuclease G
MMTQSMDLAELKKYGLYKHRADFSPSGSKVPVGRSGNVAVENLSAQERIIAESNLLPVAFLEEGALRQRAVARLPKYDPRYPLGTPWGTGFLVSKSLIMTNNHVIRSESEANDILVQFNYQMDYNGVPQPIDTWRLDPDAFFYTDASLDFTLVRVKGKKTFILRNDWSNLARIIRAAGIESEDIEPALLDDLVAGIKYRLLRYPGSKWGHLQLLKTVSYAQGQLLNCIQHPAGRMKEIAVQKNSVTEIFTDRVHYTTDTQPGSSGSPMFNNEWDLAALHHAAGDRDPTTNAWIDNEGMRIDSIVTHLRNEFSTSNQELLAELGIQ